MLRTFSHKGLRELFEHGSSSRVRTDLQKRLLIRLDVLQRAKTLDALRIPGFEFHALRGLPQRYSIHVNGPWCLTFEWLDGDAYRVNLEQYH